MFIENSKTGSIFNILLSSVYYRISYFKRHGIYLIWDFRSGNY